MLADSDDDPAPASGDAATQPETLGAAHEEVVKMASTGVTGLTWNVLRDLLLQRLAEVLQFYRNLEPLALRSSMPLPSLSKELTSDTTQESVASAEESEVDQASVETGSPAAGDDAELANILDEMETGDGDGTAKAVAEDAAAPTTAATDAPSAEASTPEVSASAAPGEPAEAPESAAPGEPAGQAAEPADAPEESQADQGAPATAASTGSSHVVAPIGRSSTVSNDPDLIKSQQEAVTLRLSTITRAPWTLQRLCEILASPKLYYHDKACLTRALEKVLQVTTAVDCPTKISALQIDTQPEISSGSTSVPESIGGAEAAGLPAASALNTSAAEEQAADAPAPPAVVAAPLAATAEPETAKRKRDDSEDKDA